MSVLVDIQIAGGAAERRLTIQNVSRKLNLDESGRRDHEQHCEYLARCSNRRGRMIEARFTHRYGDDVLALIARAGDALRSAHGAV